MKNRRAAFTLIEMMVAMALTIFVMVILSQCFVAGLETFSDLKAIGDMQEELRTATILLRDDLRHDHFTGKRRLSDPLSHFTSEKINEGFFVIGQGYPPGNVSKKITEGTEDGIGSYIATDHWLHFAVKMRGNARDKFFAAPALPLGAENGHGLARLSTNYFNLQAGDATFQENNNVFHSAWGEIVYLLLPTGSTGNTSAPGGAGTPLYALYRCQYVVAPKTDVANAANLPSHPVTGSPYMNIAGDPSSGHMHFHSPNDLAAGYLTRSFNPHTYFATVPKDNRNPPRGAALVLSNVVSFQVQVMKHLPQAQGYGGGDFEDVGTTDGSGAHPLPFDTANYVSGPPIGNLKPAPPAYTIVGLQIIIRIWDPRSRLTRQVTLLQDM
jgi:type II secretory pathway pseudopilin PulG